MPYLKILNEPYQNTDAVENVVHYITGHSLYTGSATTSIYPEECIYQMYRVKELYGKLGGRQIRHFVLSFDRQREYISREELIRLGGQVSAYYDHTYQLIWAVHESPNGNRHIHFAFNTVSYTDGRMYREGWEDVINLAGFISQYLPDGVGPIQFGYSKSHQEDG